MKPSSQSILCLAVYLLLFGALWGQAPRSVIDLDRVADLLKFPRSELVISDYLDQEKFIYTKKNVSEENSGRMPPVDPASIYQSYWIASKTPNALLPIVITISKRDAYVTPYVDKFMAEASRLPDTPVSEKGRLPFGKFDLSETSSAIFYIEEMRVPAHSDQIIDPGDTWTRLDEYPTYSLAALSIVRDSSSEVDVRIAQYAGLYYPNKLVKVPGGEEYFAAFNEDPEDNPKENPILNIFKGLNQIVLTSPIMNPYRKTPAPLVRAPELPEEEAAQPAENPPAPQKAPAPPRQPANDAGSPSTPKILALVLLALGALAAILIKTRRKRA